MFSDRLERLDSAGLAASLRRGLRGVEKETLRVDARGRLAQTSHPRGCGSPLTHPNITTDYSEALLELVTSPVPDSWQTLQQLCDIHAFVYQQIADELLWPMSMPCELDGDESIPIADYGPSNRGMFRTVYRRGLGHRYGRAMQAIAGVHFNYSPPVEFWPLYQAVRRDSQSLQSFRSEAFMSLVRNYYRNAWLVIYLYGASPAFSRSFLPDGHDLLALLDSDTWYAPFATSLRMSDLGYQNRSQARIRIGSNSLDEYVTGLTEAVTTREPRYEQIGVLVDGEYRQLNANRLQIENEYYSTIRPKPPADSARTTIGLREHGVEYVEVRTLDLSPADPVGLNQSQMRFLEVLLLYCMLSDSPPISPAEQGEIAARDVLTAREGRRSGVELPFGQAAQTVPAAAAALATPLLELAGFLDAGDGGAYTGSVQTALEACRSPESTPSARLLTALRDADASFLEYGREIAASNRRYFLDMPLSPEHAARQQTLAQDSLLAAAALESGDSEPFSDYLAKFMDRV